MTTFKQLLFGFVIGGLFFSGLLTTFISLDLLFSFLASLFHIILPTEEIGIYPVMKIYISCFGLGGIAGMITMFLPQDRMPG